MVNANVFRDLDCVLHICVRCFWHYSDACTSTFKFDYTMETETISSRNHIVKSTWKQNAGLVNVTPCDGPT